MNTCFLTEMLVVSSSALSSHQYKPIPTSAFLNAWIKRKKKVKIKIQFCTKEKKKVSQDNNNKTKTRSKRKKHVGLAQDLQTSLLLSLYYFQLHPSTQSSQSDTQGCCFLPAVQTCCTTQQGWSLQQHCSGQANTFAAQEAKLCLKKLISSTAIFHCVVMFRHKHA